MGEIITLPTPKPIPPKVSSHEHAGQRYTVTYDPIGRRWTWVVKYVQTYTFFGESNSAEAASREARRKIHNLTKGIIEIEERDAK
jgi:hypothetical protein